MILNDVIVDEDLAGQWEGQGSKRVQNSMMSFMNSALIVVKFINKSDDSRDPPSIFRG